MATVLAISSQVVRGAVGNSASVFALQRLGHTVLPLPTILLSNHPGHGDVAGRATDPADVTAMWRAIVGHGWHREIDAILTGYIPNEALASATAQIVRDMQAARPDAVYVCDPAIGDDPPGLYVGQAAAVAVRDLLLPHADIATPNCFELSWLTGMGGITSQTDAVEAAKSLNVPTVVATSVPVSGLGTRIANLLCSAGSAVSCGTDALENAPKGTGDLFGGVYLGSILNGHAPEHALGFATAALRDVLLASEGHDVLQSVTSQDVWSTATPLPVEALSV